MAISTIAGLAQAIGYAIATETFKWIVFAKFFALGAGLSIVSRALAPKPNIGAQMLGITQTTREPAGSRKIVYGQMRVGGQVVFISNTGDDNKYLHMAIVFASHEIESYEEIWFNDKQVWTASGGFQSDWGTYVTIDRKFGTAGQDASQQLEDANVLWTENHTLSGMAYIAFSLEWNADKFPQGVPNISAVLKGKKVYDPRSSTTAWSQNPALCLRDYMLDEKYGLGEVAANIDSTAFNAAANLCDEQVSIDAGGTQDRYQCNGVIDTGNQIKANIEQLLSSMGGKLTYSSGKYFVDGAEYKTPTYTFTEADIISDIQTQTKQSRRGGYNGVKGIFVSEEKDYKVLDYPAQILKTNAGNFVTGTTYKILFVGDTDFTAIGASSNNVGVEFTATGAGSGTGTASKSIVDDGAQINLDMPLPLVTNNLQAQRLAKIALLKSRQQIVISMSVNLKGLQVKVGDTIQVTNDRLSYDQKVFEVIDYSLILEDGDQLGVSLTCIETAAALYDWTTADEEDFLSGGELTLYDGRDVDNVTNLSLTEIGLRGPDGGVSSAVELTWDENTNAFVELYKIRYNKTGTTDYFYVSTREARVYISGLDITSNYDFRVQAENLVGVSSSGTTLSNQELNGDQTAPSVPTSVTLTAGINVITCEWTNPTDIDLAHVEVHVTTSSTTPAVGASPTAKISGEEYIAVGLSTDTRYFHLRSVDYSGNKSGYTAAVSTTSLTVTESDLDPTIVTGIEVVSTLPAAGYEGEVVYLTTDEKLYRYNGSSWTVAVDGNDITANSITGGKIQAGAIGTSLLAVGAIGGTVVTGTKIYHGAGTFNSAGTPFYLDDGGDFSLKDKLSFDSSASTLTVDGTIRADILDVVDATIAGNFTANNIAEGIVFGESLNTHAIAEIEDYLFDLTTKFNYKNGALADIDSSAATITSGSVSHNATAKVRFEFVFNAAWDSWGNQYTFSTNDDKATVKFEHKKSTASTWTTVYTATITAIKTDTADGHIFTVNAREFYELTGLASGTYEFRCTLQSVNTGVSYWQLAEPEPQTFYFSVYEVSSRSLALTNLVEAVNGIAFGATSAHQLFELGPSSVGLRITSSGPYIEFNDLGSNHAEIGCLAGNLTLSASGTQIVELKSTNDVDISANTLLGDSLDVRINSSTGTSIFEGNSTDYVLRNNVGTSATLQLGGSSTRYTWNTARFSGAADNTYDLGSSSVRWRDAYVAGGVTTTSDDRLKQQVRDISDAEARVAVAAKGLLKAYKYNDAVEAKGAEARWHIGIIAQDLKAAFEAEGLDAHDYGMFMWNEWWEADVWIEEADHPDGGYSELRTWSVQADAPDNAVRKDQYAIRYGELLAFIIASI